MKSAWPGHTPGPSCLSHTPRSHHTGYPKGSSQCPTSHCCSVMPGLPPATRQLSPRPALLLAGPVAHLCLVLCSPTEILDRAVQPAPTAEEMRRGWGKAARPWLGWPLLAPARCLAPSSCQHTPRLQLSQTQWSTHPNPADTSCPTQHPQHGGLSPSISKSYLRNQQRKFPATLPIPSHKAASETLVVGKKTHSNPSKPSFHLAITLPLSVSSKPVESAFVLSLLLDFKKQTCHTTFTLCIA